MIKFSFQSLCWYLVQSWAAANSNFFTLSFQLLPTDGGRLDRWFQPPSLQQRLFGQEAFCHLTEPKTVVYSCASQRQLDRLATLNRCEYDTIGLNWSDKIHLDFFRFGKLWKVYRRLTKQIASSFTIFKIHLVWKPKCLGTIVALDSTPVFKL